LDESLTPRVQTSFSKRPTPSTPKTGSWSGIRRDDAAGACQTECLPKTGDPIALLDLSQPRFTVVEHDQFSSAEIDLKSVETLRVANSRGDKSAIELFTAGVRAMPAQLAAAAKALATTAG
jgi:hypothetical protein